MSVQLEIDGLDGLDRAFAALSDDIKAAVHTAVVGTAVELQGVVQRSIQDGPASGVTYELTNPNRTHTASAAGEAPATDTGRLVGSIEFDIDGPMTAIVSANTIYAARLEFAMDRPYFRPAIEKITPKFNARLERAIKGVI